MKYEDTFLDHKIAEMTATPTEQMVASDLKGQGLEHVPVKVNRYGLTLAAGLKDTAKIMAMERRAKKMLWAGASPAQQMQAMQMIQQVKQLSADVDDNISHVRVIPRIPKILGVPPSIYYMENMFSTQAVEKLDARVAEQDGVSIELQKGPTERVTPDRTQYTEHRFHLLRNSMGLVWSSESQIRADAPIREIDYRNANLAKTRARELLALLELSKLEHTAKLDIKDVKEKNDTDAIPRSKNNPIEDFAEIVTTYNVEKSSNLSHLSLIHI